MASSDDEGEAVPKTISDYEFISDNEEPVSFTKLPIEWGEDKSQNGNRQKIFLSGKTDNGLRKIYKEVVAWKFDISHQSPEISVLFIDGHWVKLLKPRNAFLDVIRTIQITVQFLHFAKWNPEQSIKALWDHLNKTFSTFERKPSEDDLEDHMPLINEAVKRDETLANSKILSTFLEEKPRKKRTFTEVLNPPFIVDDAYVNEEEEGFPDVDENEDDEFDEDDCFDPVCAICDNGGRIYICEGKCLRAFHAKVEDGEESNCETLGFSHTELEAIKNVSFYCKNCEHKQHQCFVCGKLGSSDESLGAQVFCCVNGACGHFYHPSCVAKLLHPGDSAAAKEQEESIAAGEQFTCPAHKCHVCKELEVRSTPDLQFAICRRCPRAYHRKCLPREIAFESDDEDDEIVQRAWEGLIPNRILIYCLKHEIDPDIFTPVRDHVRFPGVQYIKKKKLPLGSSSKKDQLKGRSWTFEDAANRRSSAKPVDKISFSSKQNDLSRKRVEKLHVQGSSKKAKVATNGDRGEMSLGDKLYAVYYGSDSQPEKSGKGTSVGEPEKTQKVKPAANRINSSFTLDADSQKRILTLMKDASSSVTLEHVKQRHKTPSTHAQHSKSYVDNITMGKVEATVKAVRAALKKLGGGSVQDAKAVCGHDLFMQVVKWKDKLKVYLSPFLYGMRYTSFGRHFTKIEKLREIVDMLHLYIEESDMLVDFCCGSNDFSCLMKKKFDDLGRKCSFKNYDIMQTKNDFCFERRDWMGVRTDELPSGSRLIMGLNPPFGFNASLANRFINKALEFKPKLIVLIVPRETQRLDEKESPYDLILEDDQMFAGKSFYLPGSVDVNDKQIEDWNVTPPVFYLWSRRDWTAKHKAIAEKYGRFPGALEEPHNLKEENVAATHVPKSSQECQNADETSAVQVEDRNLDEPEIPDGSESLPVPDGRNGVAVNDSHPQRNLTENSGGKRRRKRKKNRQTPSCPENNSSAKRFASHQPSSNKAGRSSLEPEIPDGAEGLPVPDGRNGVGVNDSHPQKNSTENACGKRKRKRKRNRQAPNSPKNNSSAKHFTSHQPPSNKAGRSSLEAPSREAHHPSSNKADRSPLEARSREAHHPSSNKAVHSPLEAHSRETHHPLSNMASHSQLETHSPRVRDNPSHPYCRRDSHHLLDQRNLSASQPYHQMDGTVGGERRYSLNSQEPSSAITNRQAYAPPLLDYALCGEQPRIATTNRQAHVDYGLTTSDRSIGYPVERTGGYPYATSVMQRYASRLSFQEPSHPPMGNMAVRPPMHEASGIRGPTPLYRGGSLGFAPGPYSQPNSSGGWLNG